MTIKLNGTISISGKFWQTDFFCFGSVLLSCFRSIIPGQVTGVIGVSICNVFLWMANKSLFFVVVVSLSEKFLSFLFLVWPLLENWMFEGKIPLKT
jgi:hypothetical protein